MPFYLYGGWAHHPVIDCKNVLALAIRLQAFFLTGIHISSESGSSFLFFSHYSKVWTVINKKRGAGEPGFENVPECLFTAAGRAFVDENSIKSTGYQQQFHIGRKVCKINYFQGSPFFKLLFRIKILEIVIIINFNG